ncbi:MULTISPECIES: DEAD/DEAH box helicase [unclassified Roseateles]|uniref:DEAD/DEAH box helicase n=1 Tax=unclassified Roseateles TaxID=2626991 RepID=UPI0006F2B3B6|nr:MULTISPECIES: DEAD/DEAH box helicase [unclassified Roseateles]KQW44813.1 helicase [Pelomonas sp. Root405]KRA70172.1 helicase [Pelomonas sp. Root662]
MPVSPPHLTLRTLTRGDGLLGLRPRGPLGPRGEQVTVAILAWRDAAAEQALLTRGLVALDPRLLQWRGEPLQLGASLWTLVQEEFFGDFHVDKVPELLAMGWQVTTAPGFAHHSRAVNGWQLGLSEAEDAPQPSRRVEGIGLERRKGAWLVSLGMEVDGERIDLAPLIANLLRRDKRWLDAVAIAAIEDDAIVSLRAPGGRRYHAQAAPLKAIMLALLDLLKPVQLEKGEPLKLNEWDADRIRCIEEESRGRWQIHGDAGLKALGRRLLASGAPTSHEQPPGLGLQLRPYQLHGLAWLQYLRQQGLAGILADDMGLGKTAQALAHIWMEKQAGRLDRPALVIVPTSLLFNWQQEAARIAPGLAVKTWHGADRATVDLAGADLLLSTYNLVWRDLRVLAAQPWHLLILDEAQAVKNARARAGRALRRLDSRHRLALTGTPLENHLGELWSLFDLLMPGFLGDSRTFARHWRKPIEVNRDGARARLLAARVRPFILRRMKTEVATELPPLTELVKRVTLVGAQKQLYESVRVAADHLVRRILARDGFSATSLISVLDAMLKLRQVCCDPLLLKGVDIPPGVGRAKLEWLREHVPHFVAQGRRRLLVFSQFTGMLDLIAAELDRLCLPHLRLTGETAAAQRGDVVSRFQAREVPILLASLKAGGVGLNLTAADTVIHVDPWWNPAVQSQASARAHRIGQDQPVFVYQLVAEGSIEERMLELQASKKALADGLLGRDDGGGLTKFSAMELNLLLAPLEAAESADEG